MKITVETTLEEMNEIKNKADRHTKMCELLEDISIKSEFDFDMITKTPRVTEWIMSDYNTLEKLIMELKRFTK